MRIHFISIGGSVMHQLAIALSRKGYHVTGSDDEIFEPASTNLAKEGIMPEAGWQPEKITGDIDAVILGMHAKDDNPELKKAKETGLRIFSFPEYIYKESEHKKRVAIGGSHGKTSTTAMIMHVLKNAGVDFDYLVGARLEQFQHRFVRHRLDGGRRSCRRRRRDHRAMPRPARERRRGRARAPRPQPGHEGDDS